MRALLTYALAALACALAVTLMRLAFGGLSVDAGSVRALLVSLGLGFAVFAVVGSAAWWLGGRVLSALGRRFAGGAVLLKSFIIWGVVALAVLLWDSGPAVLRRLASEATPILPAFNPLFNSLPVYLGVWIAISLIWGSVFWLRGAAPQREGATA